jgi:hypothetical protein
VAKCGLCCNVSFGTCMSGGHVERYLYGWQPCWTLPLWVAVMLDINFFRVCWHVGCGLAAYSWK